MRITAADARASGVCARMRAWFRKHDLDWSQFCGEGIEVSDLLAIGDQTQAILGAAKAAKARLNG